MKSLLISCCAVVFLFGHLNAQEVLETPLFENTKIEGRLISHKDNVSCYMNGTPELAYTFLDYSTGQMDVRECAEIESENGSGFVLSVSVIGDFLYELVEYGGTGFTTKCYVGIIKRDMSTMQVVKTYDFGKFGIFNSGERPNIRTYKADDGLFVIAGKQGYGEQRNFIGKVDLDLNLLWQNDFEDFSTDGVSLVKSVVEDNNLITLLTVQGESKKKFRLFPEIKKSGLLILRNSSEGEIELIAPNLTEDHIVLGSKFFYDEDKKEFTGFFLTNRQYVGKLQQQREGLGYAFYRWDSEGNVNQSAIDFFSLQDLLSISNLTEYMDKADLDVAEMTSNNDLKAVYNINRSGFKVDFLENGEIIVRVNSYKIGSLKKGMKYADLEKSYLVFSLNADGSKKWVQFFPASSHQHGLRTSQIRGDKLYMYTCDYLDNFSNGKYELNTITNLSTWRNIVPAVRCVNLNDGSIEYYEAITTEVYKKLEIRGLTEINKYDDSQFGVLITHSDFKRQNWKSRLYVPR